MARVDLSERQKGEVRMPQSIRPERMDRLDDASEAVLLEVTMLVGVRDEKAASYRRVTVLA